MTVSMYVPGIIETGVGAECRRPNQTNNSEGLWVVSPKYLYHLSVISNMFVTMK